MCHLLPAVVAARQRLAEGHERLKVRHGAGAGGVEVCAALADLRDAVLRDLFSAATESLPPQRSQLLVHHIALVVHGGSGRREVAPYSDVDLMILRSEEAVEDLPRVVERWVCHVFDAGLILGHSVRTCEEACAVACQDATIASSLLEARLLGGSPRLFRRFCDGFHRALRRRAGIMLAAMEQARREESLRYGDSVYLLEPHIKRSPGGLRDIQLVRWAGKVRYGSCEPADLCAQGILHPEDFASLSQATEFLLRLRNEMHFHAGRTSDVLSRAEQVRIAARFGYQDAAGMLAVEQFMREYFRHTDPVRRVAESFLARCRPARRLRSMWTLVFGRRIPGGYVLGPGELMAGHRALARLPGNLMEILTLVERASAYDKPIAPETWEVVRRAARQVPRPDPIPPDAKHLFLTLLDRPTRLGQSLRALHQVGLLEYFVPALAHARGLLQFNQYHKYTVDEHSLRAVEYATEMLDDPGPLGRVYRTIALKRLLHLALLIHDLGKGHEHEHCEAGRLIALQTAERLDLPAEERDLLVFLVHRHLRMNHLAFRRDASDEQLVVQFAVEVGTPERLQMLYVLTAADLGATGPDTWTGWKSEILTDLYHRTMQHLAGESPSTSREEYWEERRQAVRACLQTEAEHEWFRRHLDALPLAYLQATSPEQIAADLRLLARLGSREVHARGRYLPETHTVQFTIGTTEDVASGIFHRLTGALTSLGLQILSAEINTLADRLVLDRFWVVDPDYPGQPPAERLEQVNRALVGSLLGEAKPPAFRRLWRIGGSNQPTLAHLQTRVLVDNHTSARYTVIDIFTADRRGLLYAITRTLFELGYSVWRAKIGTYLDQVVDVFYVTDQDGRKVEDPAKLHLTRQRLLEVIEQIEPQESPPA